MDSAFCPVDSGNWTLDGTVIGTVLISMSSIYLESLDYGTHVLCADLRGHAGTSDLVCLTFTVVPPPVELVIITPQQGEDEDDDWIDLEVEVANAILVAVATALCTLAATQYSAARAASKSPIEGLHAVD